MSGSASQSTPISLADLTAINDEIAALARAGVPLEKGLRELGPDLPRRLAQISADVAERLSQGQTLAEAIGDRSSGFPPIYRAVVEAGMRAGRLPAALEGLAGSARRLAEVRRFVSAAMIYPLIVLLLAYTLFVFFIVRLLPKLLTVFDVGRPGAERLPRFVEGLRGLGPGVAWWGPVIPALLLLAVGIWWYRSKQSLVLAGRGGALAWIPAIRRLVRSAESTCLTDLLVLLLEHGVALHEAIPLAAEATGNAGTVASARRIAEALERGTLPAAGGEKNRGFPSLVTWLISNERSQSRLIPLLQHTADNYREQVFRQAAWIKMYLPVIFVVAVGGTAVAAYALCVFVPMADLLKHLADARGISV